MKTGTDNENDKSGSVVQTTTTRRIIPAGAVPLGKERTTPEFWPYIEGLQPSDWDNHLLYLYRIEGERSIPLEKIAGYMQGTDGHQVLLSDREELEHGIAQKYGGRIFRLILKRGSERVTETRLYIEAPPKQVQPPILEGSGPTVQSEAYSTADVAKTAINTMANSERAAVDVAVTALRGAADVVTRLSQAPGQNAGGGDDLMRQAMAALLQKALNPPDPLEGLTKLLVLFKELTGGAAAGPGGGPPSAVVDRILNTALEKLLNPPPSSPATSAGAELVRQLPQVAAYVTSALSEWRQGSEAQRDTALVMAGRPPAAAAPGAPGAPRANPALRAAMPSEESQPMSAGTPSLEWIESKIIEILKEPISAEEAADETMAFLDRMDPSLPKQLADLGESGLMQLFQQRKTLQPALQNLPRLQEFIRGFLKFAAEHSAGDPGAAGSIKLN